MEDWIYYGLFLSDEAKATLMEALSGKIPEGWKPYCDHMTIIYNDHSENAKIWGDNCEKELGKRTVLTATDLGLSDRAMAIKVTGYPTNNALPHVTVAVAPGAKPVESNQIQRWEPLNNTICFSVELRKVCRHK